MKKLFFLLILMPLFFACSSDDPITDDGDKGGNSTELVGTKWKGRFTGNLDYYIFTFEKNNQCSLQISSYEDMKDSFTGTRHYEYQNNEIIIKSTSNQVLYKGRVDLENGIIYYYNRLGIDDIFKKVN